MVRYQPYWLDRFPKSRRPAYPKFRGEMNAGVVIVGGGLTGCACAWSFANAGVKTVVVDADRIGAGSTAGAPGLLREDFDASFQATAAAHGLRTARLLWDGMRKSSLDLAAAIRRLEIRCDLVPQDLLTLSRRDAESTKRLRKEYDARRDAGFDHSWVRPAAVASEAAVEAGGAVRTRGATIDPYRACLGFAAEAVARGAAVFERTAVRRIRARRKLVEVFADGGVFRAEAVLVATSAPLPDLRALRRHLRPEQAYAVVTAPLPAAVRRDVGKRSVALRDDAAPPHLVRWMKEDRVFIAGAHQPPVPPRAVDKVLPQRTGQLMYELSTLYPAISGTMPEWSWPFSHDATVDGLPYVGLHRNFPRHLFALGHGRHGVAVSWLAARVLLRAFRSEPAKGDELFGFARIL